MNIIDLCEAYPVLSIEGNTTKEIRNVVYDSRRVREGSLFVAIRGSRQDGHLYLEQAIRQGAAAIIVSDSTVINSYYMNDKSSVAFVLVNDSRDALAYVSSMFYQNPSMRLKVIACTGVNGRHTLAGMIYAMWLQEGIKIAYMSGMTTYTPDGIVYGGRNHPEAPEYQASLAELADNGMTAAVLPLSRQDISLKRAAHMAVEASVVMQAVDWEDRSWIQLAEKSTHRIVNIDDSSAQLLINQLSKHEHKRAFISFSIDRAADFRAADIHICRKYNRLGTEFTLEIHGQPSSQVFIGLPGRYHVYNSLAALALMSVSALNITGAIEQLTTITISGRTEPVINHQNLDIYIDTAWTAGRLENLLTALRPYCKRRLILVCGSGGNRDSQARIDLAKTAGRLADFTYLTVTNERSEGAPSIVSDLESGIRQSSQGYELSLDRKEAIQKAVLSLESGDLLIISGKGAEDYHIFAEETVEYSDREAVLTALELRNESKRKKSPSFDGRRDLNL